MKMRQKLLNKIRKFVRERFEALRWPLSSLPERVAGTRSEGIINSRAAGKRFPIRALRYWWVRCALLQEIRERNKETIVADAGCSRGNIRRFVGEIPNVKWVGLDWKIDDASLRECGYSKTYQCDFDEPLPLPDRSVDVIVFLHVIEHLPRPDFTVSEFSRVLRPGGLVLAGSPVAPAFIAKAREWQLRVRMKKGKSKPGGHINSMDCVRWKRLLGDAGMDVEMLTGTFLARWSGNPLENQAWWVRLNQLWGAMFPPLGGEVYLAGRKPHFPRPERVPCAAATSNALRWRIRQVFSSAVKATGWAWKTGWGRTCAILLLGVGLWGSWLCLTTEACPIQELAEAYQDGNDKFYVLSHPAIGRLNPHPKIEKLKHYKDILSEQKENESKGTDTFLLVSVDSMQIMKRYIPQLNMYNVKKTNINGHLFYLISDELDN